MPEAPMDKYTGAKPGEYNVRASRKIPAMKPKPITVGMKKPSNKHLGLCVPSFDARHHARTCCRVNDVHSSPFYSSVIL